MAGVVSDSDVVSVGRVVTAEATGHEGPRVELDPNVFASAERFFSRDQAPRVRSDEGVVCRVRVHVGTVVQAVTSDRWREAPAQTPTLGGDDVTAQPPTRTLQDLMDSVPSFVDHLYSNRKGSVVKDAVLRQPPEFVAPEFTTWRDEQRAWREGVAFYDQSFHMTTTYVRGADAQRLLSSVAVNSFETFGVGRSRHFVACSPDGYLVGDGVLYSVAPEEMVLVGRAAGHNWVRFCAETGGWDVSIEADEIFSNNPAGRRTVYRYQVEGPRALELVEQLTGAPLPEAPWSRIMPVSIAGHEVWAMRHTMAGNPGCEFFGPWDDGPAVKEAILKAGSAFELRRVGSLAYFTNALELGWIPRPVPAIFTGDELRPFREWLPSNSEEATWALGGSFNAPDIQDYYFTPWELGYGNVVKFDHDFVGREALERTAGDDHRRKVTLVWDPADVARVVESYMRPEETPALYIEFPRATYATWQYDAVHDDQGRTIGASTYTGFSWNERAMLSLAVVEPEYAEPGTRVSVLWGEPEGGAKSHPWLEPHRQVEIGATVAPAPIGKK
jgi:vanillate/3-O-methylgallate O-demethylase